MSEVELVCCDMAGTTVLDDGLVVGAFGATLDGLVTTPEERARAVDYVLETMGQSKIEVFTHLFGERGQAANEAFEAAYAALVDEHGVTEVPGAGAALTALSRAGIAVALTTGFSPETRDLLLSRLPWTVEFAAVVSPSDVGRGRPFPDMVLACALAGRATATARVAVVGDTWSDMEAGRRAGAGLMVGVRTGSDAPQRLLDGGAHVVLDSVADLPHLLGVG